jgi:uncharacterized protein with ATP-grasp and redox domains
MPVVVSIPDDWFGHDFSGAIFCPECKGPTNWEEISVQSPSGKDVLMFRCAKCHMITRRIDVRRKG